ncbi:hypothetical protein FACS1894159_09290 [Bacteroidia bacterium]|nr:hypothetical protein FACS1894159_09290 [Bacteroidia bacterium]
MFAVALGATLSGCLKEDDPPAITLSQSSVTLDWEAASVPVHVTANTPWSVVSDQSWCRPSIGSGRASEQIHLIVDQSDLKTLRTAVVTFETLGERKIYRAIVVTQEGKAVWQNQ